MAVQQADDVRSIDKAPSGIEGLDLITGGGLPRGRATLLIGSSGSGKTLAGVTFVAAGIVEYDEPGAIVCIEESPEQLAVNVASLGYDLNDLASRGKLATDHIVVQDRDMVEVGPFSLDGLLVRIQAAIDSVGAERVLIDGIDTVLACFQDQRSLRTELRRLVEWLRERKVTAVLTSELHSEQSVAMSVKEYVADCLLHLDHRVDQQRSTRRIRIVKYRGSPHGTNEYPFMIGGNGLRVLPVTSIGLDYEAPDDIVPSGVDGLDALLGGKGFYRGSSVLLSGMAGCGKTSFAAKCAEATCQRGQSVLFCAFEEGRQQIVRNMRSIGIDLHAHAESGLLQFKAVRPTHYGLENHLVEILHHFDELKPSLVVLDPISSLLRAGDEQEVNGMLCRLIDHFKSNGTTTLFTSLIESGHLDAAETAGVSSIMDAWLLLQYVSKDRRRSRSISVIKARGLAHCDHDHTYEISDEGLKIIPCDNS